MEVCIIPAGYKPIPPVRGGAVETIVQNMVERNEEFKKFEFTILSVEDSEAEQQALSYKNTKFVFFTANSTLDKIYYWCVYKVLKKFFHIILPDYLLKKRMVEYIKDNQDKFDWIIFEGGEVDCLKYYSKHLLNAKKIIYHSHGEVVNKNKIENSFRYYIAVSDFVKDVWNASTASYRNNMSFTLLNGINQDKFKTKLTSQQRNDMRQKLGLDESNIVLIYVGRIIPEKGVLELLKTLRLLPDNIKLLLVGSSSFGDKTLTAYEKQVGMLLKELKERVTFSGYIPNEYIGMYYQIGDISIVPSLFNDPAPLVIIESMAAGLPIITTGSGGIKEYCNSDCAIFVEKGDSFEIRLAHAIKELCTDKKRMKKMATCGRERAKSFTDTVQYKSFVELLSSI